MLKLIFINSKENRYISTETSIKLMSNSKHYYNIKITTDTHVKEKKSKWNKKCQTLDCIFRYAKDNMLSGLGKEYECLKDKPL